MPKFETGRFSTCPSVLDTTKPLAYTGAPSICLGPGGRELPPAPSRTQEFPRLKHFSDSMEPLMGTNCEEEQSFLQLPETLEELRSRLADMGLSFINQLLLKG